MTMMMVRAQAWRGDPAAVLAFTWVPGPLAVCSVSGTSRAPPQGCSTRLQALHIHAVVFGVVG